MTVSTIPGFRRVPRTGVIYVMHRATQQGFDYSNPNWANLGQGMPETGDIPGAPPRVTQIGIDPQAQEYGPITGQIELKQRLVSAYGFHDCAGPPYGNRNPRWIPIIRQMQMARLIVYDDRQICHGADRNFFFGLDQYNSNRQQQRQKFQS